MHYLQLALRFIPKFGKIAEVPSVEAFNKVKGDNKLGEKSHGCG